MKLKQWQEIKNMSAVELEAKLHDSEDKMFRMKFQNASTKMKNPLQIRVLRRLIAKIKTLLNEKQPVVQGKVEHGKS